MTVPRKDFNGSERVAIVETLRTFKAKGRPKKSERFPISTDVAAKQAGFGTERTFRQAKKVVDRGVPEALEDALVQHGLLEDDSMVQALSMSWGAEPGATVDQHILTGLMRMVEAAPSERFGGLPPRAGEPPGSRPAAPARRCSW